MRDVRYPVRAGGGWGATFDTVESYFAGVAGVLAGAAVGMLVLYLAWRLFLRAWTERRRSGGRSSGDP